MTIQPVRWEKGRLIIIDQTLLPVEHRLVELTDKESVWNAIRQLQVRGAPAIGVCAAYGVLVGLRGDILPRTLPAARDAVHRTADFLATSRPTAVNLFWALGHMRAVADGMPEDASPQELMDALEAEADRICREDTERCRAIGDHGAPLIKDGDGVLTHCNAGALATSSYGTALAVMFRAHEQGRRFQVFADETRPLLQGARLTAWELMKAGIDVTLICDNMAAQVMREGRVQLVVVGADRIAANGDTANKIGTYGVAVLARAHDIPFYVAAPLSTFDPALSAGDAIPIEQRPGEEITRSFGRQTAPEGVAVYNPAFDVTPADMIEGIITERGILHPPFPQAIRAALGAG